MPKYKVKHQGQIKEVDFDGASPTKAELRAALEMKPTFDYPSNKPNSIPNPKEYYPKDWLEKLDPHARDAYERADRNMFTVDLSKVTNQAVDRTAQNTDDDEAERKWKAQKLGFMSGASEAALNMLGAPESVLMGAQSLMKAPTQFERVMADYPGHSINTNMPSEFMPVHGREAYNSSFPKPVRIAEDAPINWTERFHQARARTRVNTNPFDHVLADQTGAVGPNIRKGHITGKFIKKNTPYEPDSFDIESAKPYEPEQLDYVKQMLDSLKLADEQKKLAGLSPKRR